MRDISTICIIMAKAVSTPWPNRPFTWSRPDFVAPLTLWERSIHHGEIETVPRLHGGRLRWPWSAIDRRAAGSRRMRDARPPAGGACYARRPVQARSGRMPNIERWPGDARGRSRATAWRDLVFTVATAPGASVADQTRASLARISKSLADAGGRRHPIALRDRLSHRHRAQGGDGRGMVRVDRRTGELAPACLRAGGPLAPGTLVEITVIAARG